MAEPTPPVALPEPGDVTGRVVVITGAASGIGAALAGRFRADGAVVIGADVAGRLDEVRAVCEHAVACDVRSAEDNRALVAHALAVGGRLDAFVANAGIGAASRFDELDPQRFRTVIEVNLDGVFLGFQAALAPMRTQGYGRLVATASRNAELCPADQVAYNASKAGVISLVRTLARDLRGTDICVNNLIPGMSATGIWGAGRTPEGARDPGVCYPTAKALVTLPPGGPSGRTFFDGADLPMYTRFNR